MTAKICKYVFEFNEEMDADKLGGVMEFAFPQQFICVTAERQDGKQKKTIPASEEKPNSEIFRLQTLLSEARDLLHEACMNLIESDYEILPNRIDAFLDETANKTHNG